MQRRRFIQLCVVSAGGGAGCGASMNARGDAQTPSLAGNALPAKKTGVVAKVKHYARVKLVDADGKPIRAKSLKANHNYVFNYPFESTPCFLLNLRRVTKNSVELVTEQGESYVWPGGVGPKQAIVAYSAICAHRLAYPSPQVSFISFRDKPSPLSPNGNIIGCCADKSVYDPSNGARVVGGPAPQPLATILLEHDAKTDEIFVTGTFGGEKFDEFFKKYAFKLSLEYGGARASQPVTGTATVRDLAAHSAQTVQC